MYLKVHPCLSNSQVSHSGLVSDACDLGFSDIRPSIWVILWTCKHQRQEKIERISQEGEEDLQRLDICSSGSKREMIIGWQGEIKIERVKGSSGGAMQMIHSASLLSHVCTRSGNIPSSSSSSSSPPFPSSPKSSSSSSPL